MSAASNVLTMWSRLLSRDPRRPPPVLHAEWRRETQSPSPASAHHGPIHRLSLPLLKERDMTSGARKVCVKVDSMYLVVV